MCGRIKDNVLASRQRVHVPARSTSTKFVFLIAMMTCCRIHASHILMLRQHSPPMQQTTYAPVAAALTKSFCQWDYSCSSSWRFWWFEFLRVNSTWSQALRQSAVYDSAGERCDISGHISHCGLVCSGTWNRTAQNRPRPTWEIDKRFLKIFYRATRMHGADYAVARCLSACLSVWQTDARLSVCHTPVFCRND